MADQLGQLTKCSICWDVFDDPRLLSCGHSFCFACLKKMTADGSRLKCPECRNTFVSSASTLAYNADVDKLPRNIHVRNLVDALQQMSSMKTKENDEIEVVYKCNDCSNPHPIDDFGFCKTHFKFICYKCATFTHKPCETIPARDRCMEIAKDAKQKITTTKVEVTAMQREINSMKTVIDEFEQQIKSRQACVDQLNAAKNQLINLREEAQTYADGAYGRCDSFDTFVDSALADGDEIMEFVSAEKPVNVQDVVTEVKAELDTVENLTNSFYKRKNDALSKCRLIDCRQFLGAQIIQNILIKDIHPVRDMSMWIRDVISKEIQECQALEKLPTKLVERLFFLDAKYDWHACVLNEGYSADPMVEVTLTGDFKLFVWAHFRKSSMSTDRIKTAAYIKQEVAKNLSTDEFLTTATNELGGYWLWAKGNRQSLYIACSDTSRTVITHSVRNRDFAMWRWA